MILYIDAIQDILVKNLEPTYQILCCKCIFLVYHWDKMHLSPIHGYELVALQHRREYSSGQVRWQVHHFHGHPFYQLAD